MADKKDQYTDEQAESDFGAGFADTEETTPAVVKKEKDEESDEDAEDKPEGEDAPEGEDKPEGEDAPEGEDKPESEDKPEEETVTVTKAQLERLLAAADKVDGVDDQIRKLFGKTGDLDQLVKNLQKSTPKGMKVEIPADAFKAMEEEYPEIAAHVRKSLETALTGLKGTSDDGNAGGDDKVGRGSNPEAIQNLINETVIHREMKVLENEHPNWRQDVGTVVAGQQPDPKHPFRVWLKTQPTEYRKMVEETDSPLVVSQAIGRFKAFKTAPKKTPSSPSKKSAAQKSRIEDAATPRGDGNPPPPRKTAEDHFKDGFEGR